MLHIVTVWLLKLFSTAGQLQFLFSPAEWKLYTLWLETCPGIIEFMSRDLLLSFALGFLSLSHQTVCQRICHLQQDHVSSPAFKILDVVLPVGRYVI